MIRGTIRRRDAIIEMVISGSGARSQSVEAVIDTGFNGYLTLPGPVITALQLPLVGYRRGRLADGSVTRLNVRMVSLIWHGRRKEVLAMEADGAPLVGMALLEGSRLTMDVVDRGDVTINEL